MDLVALLVGLVALVVALVASSRAARLAREAAKARQDVEHVRKAGSEMWDQVVLLRAELKSVRSPAVAAAPDVSSHASEPPAPAAEAPPSAEPPPGGALPVVEAPAVVPPRATIDWEQWLGVRGAAVVGGVALALAGLLFFKFSVDHGLLSPTLRVTLGLAAGVACVVGSQRLVDRYRITADALAGGGLVVLYASVWAARALYALIGAAPAFALMALFTGLASILSVRRGSILIVVLALVGGFATPLMVSSHHDNPLGLFGYILVLDCGFLYIARLRRWPRLTWALLAGTLLFEALWIVDRMGPDALGLGLGILGVFAALFAGVAALLPPDDRRAALGAQAAGVLGPFALMTYIASNARFDAHVYPLAILAGLLTLAAGWVSRQSRASSVQSAAAVGSVVTFFAWAVAAGFALSSSLAWELSLSCVGVVLCQHLFHELDAERVPVRWPASAVGGLIAIVGFSGMTTPLSSASPTSPWPWLAYWSVAVILLFRIGRVPLRGWLQLAAACGLAVSLVSFQVAHGRETGFGPPDRFLAVELVFALALLANALAPRPDVMRRWAAHAACSLSALFLVGVVANAHDLSTRSVLAFAAPTLGFALAGVFAATRTGRGPWLLALELLLVAAQYICASDHPATPEFARAALVPGMAAVVLFTVWPFVSVSAFRGSPWPWYACALAGPLWLAPLRNLFIQGYSARAVGIVPIGLGLLALAAGARAKAVWQAVPDDPVRKDVLAWVFAAALAMVSAAIPIQLAHEWITVGWALEGALVIALWRKIDHPGLKWLSLALVAAVTCRLVFNGSVLAYHGRGAWRVVNWIMYTYWVPAAAFGASFAMLAPIEVARARRWEASLYAKGRPWGAMATATALLCIMFVWLNLAVVDWFSTGGSVVVDFERLPARDLTMSLAWLVYAGILLAIGVARGSAPIRWASLILMLATIGKVFIYDLGELKDLYRVVSLLGLAASLIVISLAYQRFVFRKDAPTKEAA